MTIFSIICSAVFLFLIMRNLSAASELKRRSQGETLYVMKDTRLWVRIGRVLAGLMIIAVIAVFIYDILYIESFFDVDAFRPLALVLGLALFAIAPFSTSRWVMSEEGIFSYNSNLFIPWSQLITTGVQRKKNKTFLVLNVKKEKGELFKQTFYLLMVKPEDADHLDEMIHQFIRTIDKMKRLKHIKEEKKVAKKKNSWY